MITEKEIEAIYNCFATDGENIEWQYESNWMIHDLKTFAKQIAEAAAAVRDKSVIDFSGYETTERGFSCFTFIDAYGAECNLQESSLASDDGHVWFGVQKAPVNIPDYTRMHLSAKQVEKLIPVLQHFVKTGYLPHK